MLTLLGLSMVAVLSGKDVFKGVAACGVGLLVGTIGMAPATGEFRLPFEIDYLYDGLPLVVVGLGIFALPEIIDLLVKRGAIAEQPCQSIRQRLERGRKGCRSAAGVSGPLCGDW